jgi:hypothetical protein
LTPFSSTGNPACANESPQHDRARQARLATSFLSYSTSNQRRHRFLAFSTQRLWLLAAQARLPVLPKPCLRSASPSYRSACAAPSGCRVRAHDAAANSSAPHITTRFSARSSDSTTSRACRNLQPSARRAPYTPMSKKRNAAATKSAPPPQKRARKRKRRRPAPPLAKPAAPLATKDAFAVLFGDATTIAASSSSAPAAAPAATIAARPISAAKRSAASATRKRPPKRKRAKSSSAASATASSVGRHAI